MPIVFTCSCGKQFRAPDEFAGRHMKCSACQSLVIIPDQAVTAAAPTLTAPTQIPEKAATLPLVRFLCACGKPLQAELQYAGEPTHCPACGRRLIIPGQDTDQPTVTYHAEAEPARHRGARARDRGKAAQTARRPRRRPLATWVAAALALLILGGGGFAGWYFLWPRDESRPAGPGKEQAALADLDLVPDDAVGFFTIDYVRFLDSEAGKKTLQMFSSLGLMKLLEGQTPVPITGLRRVTIVAPKPGSVYFIYSSRKPYDQKTVLDKVVPDAQRQTDQGRTYYHSPASPMSVLFLDDHLFVAVPTTMLRDYFAASERPRGQGPLRDVLALADKHAIVAGFHAGALAPQVAQLKNTAPKGLQPYLPLADAHTAALTVDYGEQMTMDLRLIFADEAAARKGKEAARKARDDALEKLVGAKNLLPGLLDLLAAQFGGLPGLDADLGPAVREAAGTVVNMAESFLRSLKTDQEGAAVRLHLRLEYGHMSKQMAKLAPLMVKLQEAVGRKVSEMNLQRLVWAMHTYHNRTQFFPAAASYDNNGKPLLSWRVHLLPYLGPQEQALYRRFRLDEPWDSDHNRKLLAARPAVYMPFPGAEALDPEVTFFQVFTGPQTPFPRGRSVSLRDFTDGSSNTFMIVEGGKAVPWTKPEDLPYDPQQPVPKLGGQFKGGFTAALADASVRFIPAGALSEATLRAAITPAGKELMAGDWYATEPVLSPQASRYQSQNKLWRLSSGMQQYQWKHQHYPAAASFSKEGKPLLSWRVHILPYIGHAELYKRFKLDEPWDGKHNRELLRFMPGEYYPVGGVKTRAKYATFYQVFTGPQTPFPGDKALALKDFTDGAANTFLIVEAKEAVPWTKPEDVPYDPQKPLPRLGGLFRDGFHVLLASGVTRFIHTGELSEKTLRAAITPAGGELMEPDWYKEPPGDPVGNPFRSRQKLSSLAWAMINYHNANKVLPAHASYKDGKPLLSWRVHLLPYLGHANLYKQFKLDEPWDSEHNKKLLRYMPGEYYPVGGVKTEKEFATFYQVLTGAQTAFPGDKALALKDFTDGTANTLLIVEAKKAVPWTKPEDVPYDPTKPVPRLGGLFPNGFNAALANGVVRFVPSTVSEATLRAAITPAGKDVLGADWQLRQ
jgi:hypothetical protein